MSFIWFFEREYAIKETMKFHKKRDLTKREENLIFINIIRQIYDLDFFHPQSECNNTYTPEQIKQRRKRMEKYDKDKQKAKVLSKNKKLDLPTRSFDDL